MANWEIFKSKRFWTAVVGLVFMVAINVIPTLATNADLLTQASLVVIGLLIGGYSLEDAAQAYAAGKKQ